MSKVAIIGAGDVGSTLGGQLLLKKPYQVKYGVRDLAKVAGVLAKQPQATSDTVEKAVAWSDIVILATPGFSEPVKLQALTQSLLPGIDGKVVIDVANRLSYPGFEIAWGDPKSYGELLQEQLPGATVFKAFNAIGYETMAHGDGSSLNSKEQLTVLYAGGPAHKEVAEALIADVGFKPVYVGPIRYARNLEAIAELIVHLALPTKFGAPNYGLSITLQFLHKS